MDPPNTAEAVEQLGRYFRATGERICRDDLPPLTVDDHKTALAFVGELRRYVEDQRHMLIKKRARRRSVLGRDRSSPSTSRATSSANVIEPASTTNSTNSARKPGLD